MGLLLPMGADKTFSELGVKKLEEYNAIAARREDIQHMASVAVSTTVSPAEKASVA